MATVFAWDGSLWEVDRYSREKISSRAGRFNSLLALGDIVLTDTTYTDTDLATRTIFWRTYAGLARTFTVEEFLRFSIAVDEKLESVYENSLL
jgi:hypothetical protein